MRPMLSNVPIWLCHWRGSRSRHIPARSSGSARNLCILAGLGQPDAISYAGYSADQQTLNRPKGLTAARITTAISRRAEAALTFYAMLRMDWPLGSILAGFDAEARWQASSSALRDFLANMGAAIATLCRTERDVLEQVVSAQGMHGWHSAQELNARRVAKTCLVKESQIYDAAELRGLRKEAELEADYHHDRRDFYHRRMRSLRKRRSYAMAVGQLSSTLDGLVPMAERAAVHFTDFLVLEGLDQVAAESLVSKYRRVVVPRM